MKNSKNLTIAAYCLLLCTLIFSSCKVDKVEENLSAEAFSLRNVTECRLFFSGVVRDASGFQPLPKAIIELKEYGAKTFSNFEGKFTLEINVDLDEIDFWKGGKMIKVVKDKYLNTTLEIDFSQHFTPNDCNNVRATKIESEILMTPMREPVVLSRRGGDFLFRDTVRSRTTDGKISFEENHFLLWLPKIDMPEQERMMTITPRNINQTIGTLDEPQGVIFRFEAQPEGMTFNRPAMLKFKPYRKDIPEDAIYDHYVLNTLTNRWERQEESYFSFMEDGTLILNFFHFSEHLITFRPGWKIETDTIKHRTLTSENIPNCNCGEVLPARRDYAFDDRVDERLIVEDKVDEKSMRVMLADLRNNLNIPSFAGELEFRHGSEERASIAEVLFDRALTLEASLDKCSQKQIFAREDIREITGTINGKPFKYSTIVAINCGEIESRCPTSSNCHQGCPD